MRHEQRRLDVLLRGDVRVADVLPGVGIHVQLLDECGHRLSVAHHALVGLHEGEVQPSRQGKGREGGNVRLCMGCNYR